MRSRIIADIRALAAIERPPASPGEEAAARWVQSRLREIGLAAEIEPFRFNPDYWLVWGAHALAVAVAAGVAPLGQRMARAGALMSGLAAASLWGEFTTEFHLLRRLLPTRTSYNVLARLPNPGASRLLILSAHHDAPPSGLIFHPSLSRVLARLIGPARDQRVPFGATLAAMLAVSAGAAARSAGMLEGISRRLLLNGGLFSLAFALLMWDIGRRRPSPGANDDASGVAVLLALAEALAREPPAGLEVWFLSTGSEEGILGGMQAFVERHRSELASRRPLVLNLEMLGSGRTCYLKGEGFVRRYPYLGEAVALAEEVAAEPSFADVHALETAPFVTDAQVATRAGIPALTVASLNDDGYVPHYHWPSDTPETVDIGSVEHGYAFCHRLISRLTEKAERHRHHVE